jgi:hypothetical protein
MCLSGAKICVKQSLFCRSAVLIFSVVTFDRMLCKLLRYFHFFSCHQKFTQVYTMDSFYFYHFWHFSRLLYLYIFSLYENASLIIVSAETEYISTRSWYRNINSIFKYCYSDKNNTCKTCVMLITSPEFTSNSTGKTYYTKSFDPLDCYLTNFPLLWCYHCNRKALQCLTL